LAHGCNPVWGLAKKLSNELGEAGRDEKKPRNGRAVKLCETVSIRKFCAVLFYAGQATRCRHQSGGPEGLHPREDLARREHYHRYHRSGSGSRPQPTLERSVPATKPSK
jgi:hypothetical protein